MFYFTKRCFILVLFLFFPTQLMAGEYFLNVKILDIEEGTIMYSDQDTYETDTPDSFAEVSGFVEDFMEDFIDDYVNDNLSSYQISSSRLAIMPTETQDIRNTAIANSIPIVIESSFTQYTGFTVVESQALDMAIQEIMKQRSDFFNQDTAVEIGQFVGANYIIISKCIFIPGEDDNEEATARRHRDETDRIGRETGGVFRMSAGIFAPLNDTYYETFGNTFDVRLDYNFLDLMFFNMFIKWDFNHVAHSQNSDYAFWTNTIGLGVRARLDILILASIGMWITPYIGSSGKIAVSGEELEKTTVFVGLGWDFSLGVELYFFDDYGLFFEYCAGVIGAGGDNINVDGHRVLFGLSFLT